MTGRIRTVLGEINISELGAALPHEHLLAGFDPHGVTKDQYDEEQAINLIMPHLTALYQTGCRALVECTPPYMGRDMQLWQRFSQKSKLHIICPTGLYMEPYLPAYAYEQTAEQLSARWMKEAEEGLDGGFVGFIKIAMSGKAMTALERKILDAALLTSRQTGLPIVDHCTAPYGMMEAMAHMSKTQFPMERFIWAHADAAWWTGSDGEKTVQTAIDNGMWVEFDLIGTRDMNDHETLIKQLWTYDSQFLISQDAGWYMVGRPERHVRPYAPLFTDFLPRLAPDCAETLTIRNPALAFRLREV